MHYTAWHCLSPMATWHWHLVHYGVEQDSYRTNAHQWIEKCWWANDVPLTCDRRALRNGRLPHLITSYYKNALSHFACNTAVETSQDMLMSWFEWPNPFEWICYCLVFLVGVSRSESEEQSGDGGQSPQKLTFWWFLHVFLCNALYAWSCQWFQNS